MTERRVDGQDGLAAPNGQERKGWHLWVDPETGRTGRIRDADDFIREAGLRDEGYYGDSALSTMREPVSRGRRYVPRRTP